ncbi:hypothetical protein [Acidaminobacterium chupaoyuni]
MKDSFSRHFFRALAFGGIITFLSYFRVITSFSGISEGSLNWFQLARTFLLCSAVFLAVNLLADFIIKKFAKK